MDQLRNAFSLLELDAEDANGQTSVATAASDRERKDNDKGKDDALEDGTLLQNEVGNEQTPAEYRLPLVWIDLEMTGLNIEVDRILEIACVITDGKLTKSIEGPDLVIHQSKECLDKMGEWCQEHHGESVQNIPSNFSTLQYLMTGSVDFVRFMSIVTEFLRCLGLTERVLQSTMNEQEAEKQVIEFVERHVGDYKPHIAGNSVYMDLLFLRKYMPDLASLFSHIIVDVSTVKALCLRWYPRERKKAPQKENKHRAMDDIKESIEELKFYKEHIFKTSKLRK